MSNTCDDVRDRIDDLVDGDLSAADSAAVEAHLAACAACAAERDALLRLLEDAAALPEELPPARDLWPELAARLSVTPRLAPSSGWGRSSLAVAAVLLVATTAAVTAWLVRHSSGDSTESEAAAVVAVQTVPAYHATDVEYARATASLEAALRDPRSKVSPQTLAAVEKNLRVIDGALGEIRAALSKDPDNAALGRLLAATHQKKVDTLHRVLRLSQI